jgi:hypothetical protein
MIEKMSPVLSRSTERLSASTSPESYYRVADDGAGAAAGGSAATSLPATFHCEQCPKVFNRRENLSRHMKTRMFLSFLSFIFDLKMRVKERYSLEMLETLETIEPCLLRCSVT